MINIDSICAIATSPGMGAIAVIRISGPQAIFITEKIFDSKSRKKLSEVKSHTLHFGFIKEDNKIIDEVLISVFKGPNSFTGENTIEISCHGSVYIQQQILQLLIKTGARAAKPGEFTLRAYLNKKIDLSQAEAVADLIASDSEASHQIAMHQMRGGFAKELNDLREKLINFASLIELELDFSEEDVEFANRKDLQDLLKHIQKVLSRLINSFSVGNVIKTGIPVAIAGEPNVGKSTLLNALLNEERAIVSEIAGTTRDTIEDEINIDGVVFRFIDTAGIRETQNTIEALGISRTYDAIEKARVLLYMFDAYNDSPQTIQKNTALLQEKIKKLPVHLILLANKADKINLDELKLKFSELENVIFISAKQKENLEELTQKLSSFINTGLLQSGQTIVSNVRHYEALKKASEAIDSVNTGLVSGISSDFLAIDIRKSLFHLGEITGSITTDDLLENIFRNFCIGK
ncbi:MAG: tRNA uridine-5-carboxymethylaminomethyl(34) synthesis GTPase MnmE [Bacteroidetes bacterium]|nr:tRNA uridine-5-carboxymethylaminomethyl(34) synthesis GTPase MnmE [Bacteroidota bacterium]HET6244473.1 tRNA uridine-5-carboxymethylaminomethyl(34) synthesis GTPase MnmE [Bacteroidia bacterium]